LPVVENETTTVPFVLRALVPSTVVPSRNVTVPVGVGLGAATTAVKVTAPFDS